MLFANYLNLRTKLIDDVIEMDKDYAVGCLGALSYLKSPADLRTRHAAYAKSQTFKAVLNTESDDQSKPSSQLFKVSPH